MGSRGRRKKKNSNNRKPRGNSLAVQRLGLGTFPAEDAGLILGVETKIPQAAWAQHPKTKKNKQKSLAMLQTVTNEIN